MTYRSTAVLVYDRAELLDIACITTPLAMANLIGGLRDPYRVEVISPGGDAVRCETGLTLQVDGALERALGPLDTLFVVGGYGSEAAASSPPFLRHVRRLASTSRRVASVCTGAGVLAAAGLLDGRRVTTHWNFAPALARRYPQVTFDPDPIYIRDGAVATAGGVVSALDLTLALIEDDHDARLAGTVARNLVTYLHRPGNQAQISMFTSADAVGDARTRAAIGFITTHLDADLSTRAVAQQVGVSPRHLGRLFAEHVGQPPARFVRRARIDAAARLLESSALPVAEIARRCGFGSAELLRQRFAHQYGVSPTRYRAHLR